MSQLQDLTQRVEHLLLRYEELQRTNRLLEQQVADLQQERHQLELRLNAARTRIDTLLSRIPAAEGTDHSVAEFPQISGE